MAPESNDNPQLVPQPFNKLLAYVPGWDGYNAENNQIQLKEKGIVLTFSSIEPVDSSNITPYDWLDIANKIEVAYADHDGFVILHGTDTMAYTASGLAFMFENLAKPIVITGSQLPISDTRTDAVMNLVNAVEIAGWKATGLPCIPEVVICFAHRVLRGCRASKVSSTAWAGFDSPNFPPLGDIGEHIRINEVLLRPIPDERHLFHVNRNLNTNILDITLNPGLKVSQLKAMMNMEDIDGVVLRTYGTGNAPDSDAFLDMIEATAQNKIIVNITQCQQGIVEMGLYAASSGLLERGVISGFDMTPEATLAKLYWVLGTQKGDHRMTQMQLDQHGEQTGNLFELHYGVCGNSDEMTNSFDHRKTPDRRFNVNRINRAIIRFKALGASGVKKGEKVNIRIFINKPSAETHTPANDPECVTEFTFEQSGKTVNLVREIKINKLMPEGDITLSIRTDKGVIFWFEGLYLALFTET